MELLETLWCAWKAYRLAKSRHGVSYVAITERGVPRLTMFVGLGREAWRISSLAVEGFKEVERQ